VDADQWGTLVTGTLGYALLLAWIVLLAMRRIRIAKHVWNAAYVMLFPIHLWFWQFELISSRGLPQWYFYSAVIQIVGGIGYLARYSFARFRPIATTLVLILLFSLILQLFSYMYWAYGTTSDFSVSLSHLDAFYFSLGTLTTAGTGNISAISETARRLQSLQMGIDFILIGFVVVLVLTRYSNLLDRPQRPKPIALPESTPAATGKILNPPAATATGDRQHPSVARGDRTRQIAIVAAAGVGLLAGFMLRARNRTN
jgi:hypothetical protein